MTRTPHSEDGPARHVPLTPSLVALVVMVALVLLTVGWILWPVRPGVRVEDPLLRAERLLRECEHDFATAPSAADSDRVARRIVIAPYRDRPPTTCRDLQRRAEARVRP